MSPRCAPKSRSFAAVSIASSAGSRSKRGRGPPRQRQRLAARHLRAVGESRRAAARKPPGPVGLRVLITGVAGFWGNELARRLERSEEFDYIVGLDVRPPGADLGRTEFVRADIRNPILLQILPRTRVDTVIHCDVLLAPEPGKTASQLHDINVIGSLQLLAACERTETIEAVVVRGSSAIYGAEPNAPQFFTEAMARRFPLRTRFQRDIGELESYFETYARRY